jgi:hypothetical protein
VGEEKGKGWKLHVRGKGSKKLGENARSNPKALPNQQKLISGPHRGRLGTGYFGPRKTPTAHKSCPPDQLNYITTFDPFNRAQKCQDPKATTTLNRLTQPCNEKSCIKNTTGAIGGLAVLPVDPGSYCLDRALGLNASLHDRKEIQSRIRMRNSVKTKAGKEHLFFRRVKFFENP